MSYLTIALQRHLERRHLTQTDLAKAASISPSYISRFFSSPAGEMSNDHFLATLKVFAADPTAQAELIAARCMDARIGPGADLVEILVKKSSPAPTVQRLAPEIELAAETERAFAWLRQQCPLNPELEKHLVGYARLMGMK